jgi:HlyD family secretion protein
LISQSSQAQRLNEAATLLIRPFIRSASKTQRVNAIIKITDGPEARSKLGHGFRVEVKIIAWEDENALKLASSAIFRSDGSWAVFKVKYGRARLTTVEPGYNNGVEAEIIEGHAEDDVVVLYPGNRIFEGARVKQRALDQ